MSNRRVLQCLNPFQVFSRGNLEGFVGLNQRRVPQKVECAFAWDDVGSDSRTIEDVYLVFPYGAKNGWRRRANPKNFWWQPQLSWPVTAHNGRQLLNIFPTESSFYRVCRSNGNRQLPLAKIIRGVSDIFKMIILEFEDSFRDWISSFSGTLDSGEDSIAESEVVETGRSDLAALWLDSRFSWKGLDLDKKEQFSVIQSRISIPLVGVL